MRFLPFAATFILSLFVLQSQAQKVLIDNDKIRVTEYTSAPGEEVCGKGMHTHADHATILLNDAKVRTTTDDGKVEDENYSAAKHLYTMVKEGKSTSMKTDGTFWAKGSMHTVVNTGKNTMRFYIIEPK
jgi:hypothetical protein